MIVLRVLQGVAGAMLFSTGTAILTSVFPPGDRGRVLGHNVTAVYLGLALGPFAGGFLTQNFGWRSVFLVNFLLGLVLVATVLAKLRTERDVRAFAAELGIGTSIVVGRLKHEKLVPQSWFNSPALRPRYELQ